MVGTNAWFFTASIFGDYLISTPWDPKLFLAREAFRYILGKLYIVPKVYEGCFILLLTSFEIEDSKLYEPAPGYMLKGSENVNELI